MGMSADDDDYADEKGCVYGVYICMSNLSKIKIISVNVINV